MVHYCKNKVCENNPDMYIKLFNIQNRANIQETYIHQKSTLWNACAKLLSVCRLVILGLRKSALQKIAMQGSRAAHSGRSQYTEG